jgi:hypothetical protein
MHLELLCIGKPDDETEYIAGAIFSDKEIFDPLDPDNVRVYFDDSEQQLILSKPVDQRFEFARNLAESKRSV